MKKELPGWALWAAIGAGVLVLVVVAFRALGGGGGMTSDEMKVQQERARIIEQQYSGMSPGQAPNSAPGSAGFNPSAPQSSGEAAARQKTGGQ